MPTTNPNNAWASGASRPNSAVHRGTSVEYENQSHSTSSRRLAPPPNRLAASRNGGRTKPLSKSVSLQHVPDSEPEDEPTPQLNGRGKSPFNSIIDVGSKALSAASYYVRQASREPENTSNGHEASYDYSAEEREFQAAQQNASRKATANHKRGRMSTDNKAYKPTGSDLEESDEDFEEDGKTKRRKKKKEAVGGALTTLPVISQDKRRRKRKSNSKGNLAVAEEEEEGAESDDNATDTVSLVLLLLLFYLNISCASIPHDTPLSTLRNIQPHNLPSTARLFLVLFRELQYHHPNTHLTHH